MRSKRRGVALILVLGVLAILALTATVFATLAGVERQVSRNYLDGVRARLAADSGVEAAIALLERELLRGSLWRQTSWSAADGREIRVDGVPIRDAGFLGGGTYAPGGDLYRVRIADANSRLNVNDGAPGGPDHSVSRNLRRILNILGAQPSVNVPGLGDKILRSRPSTGYASAFDLIAALDRDAFERVRPFVTVSAWSDPDVCQPVPLSSETARLYAVDYPRPSGEGGPLYRFGHQRNFRGEPILAPLRFFDPLDPDPAHNAVWGRDSLNPGWIEIVRRSPVNVNTASREVLLALIIDLEGFLLVERRRDLLPSGRGAAAPSPCASPGAAYGWTSLRYRYDGQDDTGGECGRLYRTVPFVGPGGRSTSGNAAATVVEEILACRERKRSPAIADLDYAAVPFGGPFGSWAQFNLFVDALVDRGLLVDRREEFFWDLDADGRPVPGSAPQLRAASRAIGDVLKANFNPNLHLNELNPNATLFTHVDKTDLLVQSTEFCFTPMGSFEIESEGRIVRPAGADDHETVAMRRTVATVKLFDAVRETSQAQFARGEIAPRTAGTETNNNRGVEIGPEPDNGPAPAEAGYEGYLQLSTIGSNFMKSSTKPKGELWTTLSDPSFYPGAVTMGPGGGHLGSAIHAHFQFDHAAHHHASCSGSTTPPWWNGFRLPQGPWQSAFGRRGALNRNWEDRTEVLPSPYSPVDGTRVGEIGRYRLCRTFTAPPPPAASVAPSDLRLDGAYIERDSAIGYWIDENVSFNFNEGTVAFWLKPAFTPESTGKRRTLLSLGRYHAAAPTFMNPSPFGLFFVPPHGGDVALPPTYAAGLVRFPPSSLAFGFGFSSATGYSWEMGGKDAAEDRATSHAFVFSPTLNRDGRGLLRAHEWTHVAVTWDNPRDRLPDAETAKLYVNGRVVPGTVGMPHLFAQEGQPFRNTPWWSVHSLQVLFPGAKQPSWVKNTIRLGGEPSKLFDLPGDAGLFPGNFSADATFDEFYVWLDRAAHFNGGLWGMQQLWSRGRYYRANDLDPADARFASGPIDLGTRVPRSPGAGPRRRFLGVAWTEFGEAYDSTGTSIRPKMLDYSVMPPAELHPSGDSMVDLGVESRGASYGPFRDAAFSPVRDSAGAPVALEEPAEVQYTAKLKTGAPSRGSTILLSSPVLDDVTLFFDSGRPQVLGWVRP